MPVGRRQRGLQIQRIVAQYVAGEGVGPLAGGWEHVGVAAPRIRDRVGPAREGDDAPDP